MLISGIRLSDRRAPYDPRRASIVRAHEMRDRKFSKHMPKENRGIDAAAGESRITNAVSASQGACRARLRSAVRIDFDEELQEKFVKSII